MAIIGTSKSGLNDLEYFKQNLLAYDPRTKTTREIREEDLDAEIVCWGESHRTTILPELQRETARRIAKTASCCICLEGIKPGEVIKKLPGWENLSENITFQGSDIRSPATADEYIAATERRQKWNALFQKRKEAYEVMFREWGRRIDEARISHTPLTSVIASLVPPPSIEVVEDEVAQYSCQDVSLKYEIRKSNERLAEEMIKASSKFSKVMAIWGSAHFVLGDKIFEKLAQLQKRYLIVVANRAREEEALLELEWQRYKFEPLSVTVHNGSEVLKIPRILRPFFHPEISLVVPPTPSPRMVNSFQLLDLCKTHGDRLEFASSEEVPLRFTGMSTEDLINLEDAILWQLKSNKRSALPDYHLRIASAINNLLLLGNRSLKVVHMDHFKVDHDISHHEWPSLQLISQGSPLILELTTGSSIGSAAHLLADMIKYGVDFEMKPESNIVFTDITPVELVEILQDPASRLFTWLSQRAPAGAVMEAEGQMDVGAHVYQNGIDPESKIGLYLITTEGFKIRLSNRPQP
jgi:hypothetical protein